MKIKLLSLLFLISVSFISFTTYSQVELVQGGSDIIPSGTSSITVNIPTPVDDAKSLLIVTAAPVGTSNGPESTNVLAQLNCSGGTCNTIRIQRYGTTGTIDIGWKIVEFEDSSTLSITRGTVQHIDFVQNSYPTPDTYTVNIGATVGKSFVLLTDYANGVVTSMHDSVSGELDINGDLVLTVGESKTAINQGEIAYQVVEYGDSNVKYGSFLLEDDTDIHSIPVSGGIPNPDKSWLIYNFWNNINSSSPVDKLMIRGSISGNNVVFDRNRASSNSYDVYGTYFLVEFTDNTSVQQANMSFTSSELTKTASLSKKVNVNCAIPVVGYQQRGGSAPTAGYNYSPGWFIPKLVNDGADISLTRGETNGVEADAYWSVIQFDYCSPPIEANDDNYPTPLESATGGILGDITANDSYDSVLNPDASVTLTIDNDGGSGATIDSNGVLSIPAGTSGGIYTLTYTICNNLDLSFCDSATVSFIISYDSTTLDFDGVDDYVEVVSSAIDGLNDYTISCWFKYEGGAITGSAGEVFLMGQKDMFEITVRDWGTSDPAFEAIGANIFKTSGLSQSAGKRFDPTDWTHITVTVSFDGTDTQFKVFRNGWASANGLIYGTINTNSNPFRIGIANGPSSYVPFEGAVDEVRIFNKVLTDEQIQRMVYQEIKNESGNVRGTVIDKDIEDEATSALIPWTDLIAYYPMTNMVGSKIQDESSYNNDADLYNMTTFQEQTAPMPYETVADGNWTDESTWLHGDIWDIEGLDAYFGASVQNPELWSIVKVHHNVSTNSNRRNLGLFIDEDKTLTVNGDNSITNSWYLQLDGTIDLADDSQLVQTENSDLVTSATGKILRRQEGTPNIYRYNYWSSPVGSLGATSLADNNGTSNNANNTPFSLNMLKDGTGTPMSFTTAFDEVGKISTEWLYYFQNGITYHHWQQISPTYDIPSGVGYTQKGTGNAGTEQQYIFEGKPNNGTILVSADDVSDAMEVVDGESKQNVTLTTSLIGNPYPSALDANQFINDNKPGTGNGTISGTILLWEQWSGSSHYLATYEGGYGYINNLTTVRAYQHIDIPISGGTGEGVKVPTHYISVGQGFFVEVIKDSGDIEFNNGQRVFKKEALGESVFMRSSNTDNSQTSSEETAAEAQILRLEFGVSSGASRSFVLGFTEDATDGYDYGLDGGLILDPPADDMGSLLDGQQYVIQAFAPFTPDKEIDLVLHASGNYTYTLKSTEVTNFPEDQDLFMIDNLTGQSFNLRSTEAYNFTAEAGSYTNRFQVVFQDPSTLSNEEFTNEDTLVYVNQLEDKLYVKALTNQAKQLTMTNMLGQTIKVFNSVNNQTLENGIDISNLNSGVYLVSVLTENNQSIDKKVIIN